jgi:hypothetical protein
MEILDTSLCESFENCLTNFSQFFSSLKNLIVFVDSLEALSNNNSSVGFKHKVDGIIFKSA